MQAMRWLGAILILAAAACCGCGAGADRADRGKTAALRVLAGTAVIEGKGAPRTVTAGREEPVRPGETIVVAAAAEALLVDGAQLEVLAAGTRLQLGSADPASGELQMVRLLDGVVTFLFPAGAKKERRFEAVTNTVVAAVRGTVFRVEARGDVTRVTVLKGEVEVRAPSGGAPAQTVTAGRAVRAAADGIAVDAAPAADSDATRVDMLRARSALGIDISNF